MNINDFSAPPYRHPYDLLGNYRQAYEKEVMLTVMLTRCFEAGDLHATVDTIHSHPTMVDDGLLEKAGLRKYKLTKKAIGLLYSEYGKEG